MQPLNNHIEHLGDVDGGQSEPPDTIDKYKSCSLFLVLFVIKNGEIAKVLSEGMSDCSQPINNHVEDLRDLDEGQAECPDIDKPENISVKSYFFFFATKNGEITEALSEGVRGHSRHINNHIENLGDLNVLFHIQNGEMF